MDYNEALKIAEAKLKNCSNCIYCTSLGCANLELVKRNAYFMELASEKKDGVPYCEKYKRNINAIKAQAVIALAESEVLK